MDRIRRQYGGEWSEKYLYFFGIALATFMLTTNVMALKFFQVYGIKLGAGMLFFPLCLIVGDIVTEVYGFKKTRQIIIAALMARLFFMVSAQIVIALPPAPEWHLQTEFEKVFGDVPRFLIASCLAYLAGELSNSWIMSRMKLMTDGRHFWLRAMVSTVVGEALNTAVFQLTAFAGTMSFMFLMQVIVNGTVFKSLIEALVLPLTTWICREMKRLEGIDYFDGVPAGESAAAI